MHGFVLGDWPISLELLEYDAACNPPAEFSGLGNARNLEIWLVDHYDGPQGLFLRLQHQNQFYFDIFES